MTGTGRAGAQSRARLFMRISALAIAVGQALDVSTTNTVLASGGTELNPLMRMSMAELGSLWWLPKAATAVFILACVFSGRMQLPTRRIIALTKIALAVSAITIAINIANVARLAAG
jgi:succinate dehydrogenase hydrophobic anchor subunit